MAAIIAEEDRLMMGGAPRPVVPVASYDRPDDPCDDWGDDEDEDD